MKIFDIFCSLQGTWVYHRILKDKTSGLLLGSVEGKAVFEAIKNKKNMLHYKEEGEFTSSSGQKVQAFQEYLYTYNPEKDQITKHFSKEGVDTGFFYLLKIQLDAPPKKAAEAVYASGDHLCVKDQYRAKYEFLTPSKFRLDYDVIGPAKNYVSSTTFRK